MNITEVIRKRVNALRAEQRRGVIDIVNYILESNTEKGSLMQTASYLGIGLTPHSLETALTAYKSELERVAALEDGIFRQRGTDNGYTLTHDEDSCWGTYYDKLVHDGRSREDLQRIIDECNVLVQEFLTQPAQNADRRGLVIGQVQSGKTTIFNGVISTAADMAFNLIIVLSGTLESLRRQTQSRIMKDVTGPWGSKPYTPFYFTWISKDDEPGLRVNGQASQMLPALSNQGRRQVAIGVFLKNASVLSNLRGWLSGINPSDYPNIRALVIDDEADQATPNAGVNRATITAINQGIKSLIIADPQFPPCPTQGRTSYLGFTATPFANLLNEAGDHTLYPRDFLYFLRSSDRYFGPWQLFGNPDEPEGEETIIPLDVIRILEEDDVERTVPSTERPRPLYRPTVSPGLRKAIRWYALAAAARRVSNPSAWATMLVHTSSRTADHIALFEAINGYCGQLLSDWTSNRQEWLDLWNEETAKVNLADFALAFPRYGMPAAVSYPAWEQVVSNMEQVIRDIKIKIDNSLYNGSERIFYSDSSPDTDRLQIAIGGNTLSRGLTLEGLVSSYFARRLTAQTGYDTLLQMGRWFGFRQGYELLTRLWTTDALRNGFRDLVIMELNLRKTMQLYLGGLSPANQAPVITKMPAMAITRKSVMGQTTVVEADYSGAAPQTISFFNETEWLKNNINQTKLLLENIEQYLERPDSTRLTYRNVPVEHIITFIRGFNFWPQSNTFNKRHMQDFIEKNKGSYLRWTVVVMGGRRDKKFGKEPNTIHMINRSRVSESGEDPGRTPSVINVKSLRATRDLLCDNQGLFTEGMKEPAVWAKRKEHQLNPVLIVYPIDKDSVYNQPPGTSSNFRVDLHAVEDVIGISLVMNPPTGTKGAVGVQLDVTDAYENDEDADSNPDLSEPAA